jgi:hypothetical protein
VSTQLASRPITSGSRRSYSKVEISSSGVVRALGQIARTIQRHLGVGCVATPDGVDAIVGCRLVEVLEDGTEREVPATEWAVDASAEGCPGERLRMTYGAGVPTNARLECVVEP